MSGLDTQKNHGDEGQKSFKETMEYWTKADPHVEQMIVEEPVDYTENLSFWQSHEEIRRRARRRQRHLVYKHRQDIEVPGYNEFITRPGNDNEVDSSEAITPAEPPRQAPPQEPLEDPSQESEDEEPPQEQEVEEPTQEPEIEEPPQEPEMEEPSQEEPELPEYRKQELARQGWQFVDGESKGHAGESQASSPKKAKQRASVRGRIIEGAPYRRLSNNPRSRKGDYDDAYYDKNDWIEIERERRAKVRKARELKAQEAARVREEAEAKAERARAEAEAEAQRARAEAEAEAERAQEQAEEEEIEWVPVKPEEIAEWYREYLDLKEQAEAQKARAEAEAQQKQTGWSLFGIPVQKIACAAAVTAAVLVPIATKYWIMPYFQEEEKECGCLDDGVWRYITHTFTNTRWYR